MTMADGYLSKVSFFRGGILILAAKTAPWDLLENTSAKRKLLKQRSKERQQNTENC